MKAILVLVACVAGLACCAPAPPGCPLPSQRPMLMIELFFGRDIAGRAPVSDAEWAAFARTELTPRFPDGFTALDAQGQWRDPQTNIIGAEASKLVRIETTQNATTAARIAAIAQAYRTQFHQIAVGISTSPACAAF